jgi:hypothetical protein
LENRDKWPVLEFRAAITTFLNMGRMGETCEVIDHILLLGPIE